MKKSNVYLGLALIYLILFGVFNLLAFVIFKERTSVFWVSYTFMTIAFLVQFVVTFLSFRNFEAEALFFNIPLASFSVYYLCAALAVGAVFMIFQKAGVTLALVLQLLILAAFLVISIISILSRDAVKSIGDNVKKNVTNWKSVLVDVEMLVSVCTDPELKSALLKLADTVKYSDPMSTEAVENVEQRIMVGICELRVHMDNSQTSEALEGCRKLELLLVERNKKLALSK